MIHENGRTTYEMITQHTAKHKIMGFGEKIDFQFKISPEKKNSCSNDKSGTGYFIGIINRNTQYLVATADGVVTCSTVRRLPDTEAYNKECIKVVNVTYAEYIKRGARSSPMMLGGPPVVVSGTPDKAPITTSYQPRAVQLKTRDFETHGYTAGCPQCEFAMTGIGNRQAHSTVCRQRMEKAIMENEDGKMRFERANERIDKWIGEQGAENAETAGVPAASEGGNAGIALDPNLQKNGVVVEDVGETVTLEATDPAERARILKAQGYDPSKVEPITQGSTARASDAMDYEIHTPVIGSPNKNIGADTSMEEYGEEFDWSEAPVHGTEGRVQTPERNPPTKRDVDNDDDDMGEHRKARRLSEDENMLSVDQTDVMSEEERKILAAIIMGVDIVEVYSPVRVAAVAARFGLTAGSSFDLTNGWDFDRDDHKAAAWR